MSTVIESLLVGLGFDADTSGANKFTGAMDGVVGKAMAVASIIGGLFVSNSFIETASQFEQFETQLETIQGSSEKAKESLAWISEFAVKTPYEMQDVTDAFVKLQSYGLDAQKGGLLESLGNMASGMGKSLDMAVEAIADAVTGENERLKEFGIRASKKGEMFTYKYTMDGKDFKVQAKNEAADIQKALQGIMDARFKGGMERMSKTWAGTLSNLSDVWSMFKLKVMSNGAFDLLKDRLNNLMMALVDNKDAIDEWANKIGDAIVYVIERVESIGQTIRNWADDLGITEHAVTLLKIAITYLGVALTGLAVGGAIKATLAALGMLVSPIMLIGAAIGTLLLLIDDFMGYQEGRPSFIGKLIDDYPWLITIKDAAVDMFTAIKEHATAVSVAIGILTAAYTMMKTQAIISFVATRISAIASFTMIAAQAIAAAIAAGAAWLVAFAPFVLLAALIAAAIYGFWQLYKNWDQVWEFISTVVGVTVDAIKEKFNSFIQFFVDLGAGIKSALDTAVDWIKEKLTNLIPDWLKNLLGKGANVNVNVNGNIPANMNGGLAVNGNLAKNAGNSSVNTTNNTTINVPTATAAGQAANQINDSGAKNAAARSRTGVHQ